MTTIMGDELTHDEELWLRPYNWDLKDLRRLSGKDRKILFARVWNEHETAGVCHSCHMPEGRCDEAICIRLRVTHKLGLQDWMSDGVHG